MSITIHLPPDLTFSTWKQVLDYMVERFDDDSAEFRANLKLIVKDVLLDLAAAGDWSWLNRTDTFATQANLAEYTLAEDVDYVKSVWISGRSKLTKISVDDYAGFDADSNSKDTPSKFAAKDRNVVLLYPTPDAVYTVSYNYQYQINDNIDDEDSAVSLPRSEISTLIAGVELKQRLDDNQYDLATATWQREYGRRKKQSGFRDSQGQTDQWLLERLPPGAD